MRIEDQLVVYKVKRLLRYRGEYIDDALELKAFAIKTNLKQEFNQTSKVLVWIGSQLLWLCLVVALLNSLLRCVIYETDHLLVKCSFSKEILEWCGIPFIHFSSCCRFREVCYEPGSLPPKKENFAGFVVYFEGDERLALQ
uniref:Uncharacterized protein n=1 Tax=Lactuca sativa TaxID=4236 RepID=A0A9R1XXW5_LACSA|nr:hypothetical protein LSAT_V11C100026270 [Lactuca sativa]